MTDPRAGPREETPRARKNRLAAEAVLSAFRKTIPPDNRKSGEYYIVVKVDPTGCATNVHGAWAPAFGITEIALNQ